MVLGDYTTNKILEIIGLSEVLRLTSDIAC
jgi:hypothetical protein